MSITDMSRSTAALGRCCLHIGTFSFKKDQNLTIFESSQFIIQSELLIRGACPPASRARPALIIKNDQFIIKNPNILSKTDDILSKIRFYYQNRISPNRGPSISLIIGPPNQPFGANAPAPSYQPTKGPDPAAPQTKTYRGTDPNPTEK